MRNELHDLPILRQVWASTATEIRSLLMASAIAITNNAEQLAEQPKIEGIDSIPLPNDVSVLLLGSGAANYSFASETAFFYVLSHALKDDFFGLWNTPNSFATRLTNLSIELNRVTPRDFAPIFVTVFNNEYEQSACALLSKAASDESSHDFWDLYHAFTHALPYLDTDASLLAQALHDINSRTVRDFTNGLIYNAVEDYCQRQVEKGWELYAEIVKPPYTIAVNFTANILIGIAKNGELDAVYTVAMNLTHSDIPLLRQCGVAALGALNYNTAEPLLRSTIQRMKELSEDRDEEVGAQLVRGYFKLLSHNESSIDAIMDLSSWKDPATQYRMVHELSTVHKLYHQDDWFRQCLLNLVSIESQYKGTVNLLDDCLRELLEYESALVIEFLRRWVRSRPEGDSDGVKLYSTFSLLFAELCEHKFDELQRLITESLNDDDARFHNAVEDIIDNCSPIESDIRIALSEDILNDLNDDDLQFILIKILGHVIDARALCALTLSILRRNGVSDVMIQEVESAFMNYIYYNYPAATKAFLNSHKGSKRRAERSSVKRLLEAIKAIEDRESSLPRLTEFMPPFSRSSYFFHVKNRRQQSAIHEGVHNSSVLMQMITRIPLKGGMSWTMPTSEGLQRSSLGTISMSVDIPIETLLDPIGIHMKRLGWRSYKRGD